jgi:hypothetical protein
MRDRTVIALCAKLVNAKLRLGKAALDVRRAEEELIKETGFDKAEGQETYDASDEQLGMAKIVLKQPINTKVDSEAWPALRRTLAKDHPGRECFRTKYEVNTKPARVLQDSDDPEKKKAWAEISDVIERSPGKVQVEVKGLELLVPSVDAIATLEEAPAAGVPLPPAAGGES